MTKFFATAMTTVLALSISAPAFAEDSVGDTVSSSVASTSVSSAASSKAPRMMKVPGMMKKPEVMKKATTKDGTCMAAAVDKRESAIIASVATFSTSVTTALTTRKDSLMAAYALSDKAQRNTAVKAAWTSFQGTWKKATTALRTTKKTAWSTFKTDAKACGDTSSESSGEGLDLKI